MTGVHGREPELAELGDLLKAAVSGAGRVALVEGPAGIGKSRLLAAVAEMAADRGMVVAAGGADELDRVTPWAPLLAAVASAGPLSEAVDLGSLGGLVDRRLEVIDRIRAAFEAASSRRPILVMIDDLQWADPATLMALGSLPRQLFSYPVAWVLARRPVPAVPQLRTLLARLEDDGSVRLRLGPLDPAASAALAADVLGAEPDQQAAALVAGAAGNPFYVVELLKAARGVAPAGDGHPRPRAAATVPRSFRATVAAHLRALSPDASQFVKVACVLGRVFSLDEVAAMTGEPASRLLPAVEEALAAEVLIEAGDRLAFRHDLLRQAVDQDLPRPVREALHRDAASALMATGAPLIRVASQLVVGARPGDEQAIAVLEQAIAEVAGASPVAAADLAVRVLELIGPDDPRRAEMVAKAVRPLGWAGRLEEALALGEGYLAGHHPPPHVEAAILLGVRLAWVASRSSPYPHPLPEKIISDATVSPGIRANLIALQQVENMAAGRPKEADSGFAEAVRLAGQSEPGEVETASVFVLWEANALICGDFLEAARRARIGLDQAAAVHAAGPDFSTHAYNVAASGVVLQPPGRTLSALEAALHAAEACGFTYVINRCQCLRAGLLLDQGNLDDARAEARAAAAAAEDLDLHESLVLALSILTETSVRQGDLSAAAAAVNRMRAEPEVRSVEAERTWATALYADARGSPGPALDALAGVFAQLRHHVFLAAVWHPDRLARIVAVAQRAGDAPRAAQAVAAADELARRNPGVPVLQATLAHARGLAEHDPAQLRRAVALLAADGRRLAAAAAQEDLGRMLASSGAPGEGIPHLEAAYSAYTAANARQDTVRVRRVLRTLGVRKRHAVVARPDRGWAGLTSAELAVVRIVAQGCTNREAARQLFLSPDTINTHLRHAFAKLGIHSRAELVRVALEHEAVLGAARARV